MYERSGVRKVWGWCTSVVVTAFEGCEHGTNLAALSSHVLVEAVVVVVVAVVVVAVVF